MNKYSAKKLLSDGVATLAASFLSAWALYSFINPNNFVGGGFGGISTILEAAGIMKSSLSYLLLNIPALIAALILLKGDFTVKTIVCTVLVSLIMSLMERFGMFRFTEDRLLSAVYSGILYGLGAGIMFECGGCAGGTEIIAKIIVKYRPTASPSKIILLFDIVVIAAGLLLFDVWSVVYALICSFAFERSLALYLGRGARAGMYYVVTSNPDALLATLGGRLSAKGYSLVASGGYTGADKTVIKLLLPAGNANKFREALKDGPSDAFAFVAAANKICDGGAYEDKH